MSCAPNTAAYEFTGRSIDNINAPGAAVFKSLSGGAKRRSTRRSTRRTTRRKSKKMTGRRAVYREARRSTRRSTRKAARKTTRKGRTSRRNARRGSKYRRDVSKRRNTRRRNVSKRRNTRRSNVSKRGGARRKRGGKHVYKVGAHRYKLDRETNFRDPSLDQLEREIVGQHKRACDADNCPPNNWLNVTKTRLEKLQGKINQLAHYVDKLHDNQKNEFINNWRKKYGVVGDGGGVPASERDSKRQIQDLWNSFVTHHTHLNVTFTDIDKILDKLEEIMQISMEVSPPHGILLYDGTTQYPVEMTPLPQ